eukprot:scaffold857_cov272-Pinguiococcus_pyrenoidosus.AAC.2
MHDSCNSERKAEADFNAGTQEEPAASEFSHYVTDVAHTDLHRTVLLHSMERSSSGFAPLRARNTSRALNFCHSSALMALFLCNPRAISTRSRENLAAPSRDPNADGSPAAAAATCHRRLPYAHKAQGMLCGHDCSRRRRTTKTLASPKVARFDR